MSSIDTPKSFHRIVNVPIDDSSTFNSIYDLMNYCQKKQSVYDGQVVTVNFYNGYTQDYVIKKTINGNEYLPVPSFKNTELNTINIGSEIYVLVYYRNGSNGRVFANNILSSLNDIYSYSIIDNIPLFVDNRSFSFYMTIGSSRYSWTQNFDPCANKVYDNTNTKNGKSISGGVNYIHNINNEKTYITSDDNSICICPKSENNDIVRLYVKATSYFRKVGVV